MRPMFVVPPASPAAADAFAEQLRERRRAAGLTQEALAERAGLSVRGISDLERGVKAPQRATVDLLARALALPPEEKRALARAAERGRLRRADGPRAAGVRRHNLPVALTSFVGRERELAEVARLLGGSRLVTLTGPGGVGKTRLALRIAEAALPTFADGVWFVDLAPLSDSALVPRAIAGALAIPEQSGRPVLTTMLHAMRDLTLLVILDNCEHLIDACARVADALLCGCPAVQILATSREPLGIGGEVNWPLAPLPAPTADWRVADDPLSLIPLARLGAVQLFVERARAANPSFALTVRNATAVAEVCRRLDGIPLALELAATRVRAFTPERIAARLDDQFRLLTGGSRAALPRQQTLRATLDWSHDLLSAPERALFRRLAVFAGGGSYAAVAAVCGDDRDERDLPDLLGRLVDRSLVIAERQEGERYRLLEPLRQYAQEKLVEAGEVGLLRDRHRGWCLALALEAIAHAWGPEQGEWYDRLEADHDNLRAAMAWCIACGDARSGLELAWGLHAFWTFRGYHEEERSSCERLLALPDAAAPSRGRAFALVTRGWFSDAAAVKRAAFGEAVEVYRAVGEERWAAFFSGFLATVAALEGDERQAFTIVEESLAVARRLGDRWLEGQVRKVLSVQARRLGDDARALALMEESLACSQVDGDVRAIGLAHVQLGAIWLNLGEVARARAAAERALEIVRELKMTDYVVEALIVLAAVERLDGNPDGAQRVIDRAVQTAFDARNLNAASQARLSLAYHDWVTGRVGAPPARRPHETMPLEVFRGIVTWSSLGDQVALHGLALLGREQTAEGVALLGAARRFGFRPTLRFPDERRKYEAVVGDARQRLGAAAFAAAWAAGEAMTREQAMAYALDDAGHA